jgi:hypothetical protein
MTVPNLVVVFLCVIAAGAVVVVGAAFGKQFLPGRLGGDTDDPERRDWSQMSPEQEAYCRKVREINQMALFDQVRQSRPPVDYESGTGYVSYSASQVGAYTHGRYSTEHLPTQGEWSEVGR